MWLFAKLAWRNLFRNKRRTLIAGSAIGIGLASLIFIDALFIGMEEHMIRAATSSFAGEGQIHRQGLKNFKGILFFKIFYNICCSSHVTSSHFLCESFKIFHFFRSNRIHLFLTIF